jgi:hypothetical protein
VPSGLAVLAFALALVQRPGATSSDTKIDLHVDPLRFLADVASAWSPTADLGHVQGGQYSGYLFPMAPWFALGRLLGLPDWLVQRLWLGALLALGAWGVVRLLDALLGRPRSIAHIVAGLLFVVNPYVVVFSARTSVTLLGYAALPWMLLCVHRGARAPRSWWWPAALALAVTVTGGGVNAAVTAWVLVGPLLLAAYEWWAGGVRPRDLWSFTWRAALTGLLASAWWVVPVLVQARFGVDFLRFTEQPGTIWSTTSLSESLRLMGYWISYLGVGYGRVMRPYFGDGGVLLFSLPVVLCQLLVPALVIAGLRWSRRWRYAPFALALLLAGLLIMSAGFPEGTPLRKGVTFAYNHVTPLQFLRTTYKAGPLVALALACLGGAAAPWALRGLRRRGRWPAPAAGALGAALLAVSCWPLITGHALDPQLTWQRIPPAWSAAAKHIDRTARDGRAVMLPGQLYAAYDWGGTVDPVMPTLTRRPVAVRNAVPYADLHAVNALWAADDLVQQRRALPGELGALLDLMSARTVVAATDDDTSRSGAAPAADAADVLDELGRPDAAWGPVRPAARAPGSLARPRALPELRAWDRPSARPLVRLEADTPAAVVDGSAEGIAGLAATGALPRAGRLAYAGDLSAGEIRTAAAAGSEIAITDSNRRQVIVSSSLAQNRGAVLTASEPPSPDAAVLDPWATLGPAAQTVTDLSGVRSVFAPASPAYPQFPERRPAAALDGDPRTAWLADRELDAPRHWLEVGFERPRDVGAIDLLPYSDATGRVRAVEIAGRSFAVHPGWNHIVLGLHAVTSLRVRIERVDHPLAGTRGAGGISELRIPGVRVAESLRPPVLAERALAGRKLAHAPLAYVFQRTTGDDPFRRDASRGELGARLLRDRGDAEAGLARTFAPPTARTWAASGWASASPATADPALDRLAGTTGGRFASSGRFQDTPGWRASSAFDGGARPWIAPWGAGGAWLAWSAPHAATIRELRLRPAAGVRRPTLVRLRAHGTVTPPLSVTADGRVRLPAPLHGRAFRLEVLDAAFASGASASVRQRPAVGIAELSGRGVPRAHVPRTGRLHGRCGDLAGTLGGQPMTLRATGSIAALDAGRPLRVRGCGSPVALKAGRTTLTLDGRLAPYLLQLRSPAPEPLAPPAPPGRVLAGGNEGRDRVSGIRLEVTRPGWLVLGQSFDRGWSATCDGHDLGAARPVDAFAMGWRVPAGCRAASLAFAPDGAVRIAYAVSAFGCLGLLALLLVRRRPRADARPPAPLAAEPPAARLSARRAAVAAVVIGLALGFAFAARTAPLMATAAYVILRRGVPARTLATVAAGLLVIVVPILTIVIPVQDKGGFNSNYPVDRIAVHWVTVAAVVLLGFALARWLSTARVRRPEAPAARPADAAEPAPAP